MAFIKVKVRPHCEPVKLASKRAIRAYCRARLAEIAADKAEGCPSEEFETFGQAEMGRGVKKDGIRVKTGGSCSAYVGMSVSSRDGVRSYQAMPDRTRSPVLRTPEEIQESFRLTREIIATKRAASGMKPKRRKR